MTLAEYVCCNMTLCVSGSAVYMYSSLTQQLSQFSQSHKQQAFGSTSEAIEHVGKMLERMELPPLKLPLLAVPFWGSTHVQPGRKFLNGCRLRLRIYMAVTVLQLIGKQITLDGHGTPSLNAPPNGPLWEYGFIYFTMAFVMAVLCACSARLPMDALIHPFLMPLNQSTAKLRTLQFTLIFPLATGTNAIISLVTTSMRPQCMWWVRHSSLYISIVLFIAVLIGHRVWVPPFIWGFSIARDEKDNSRPLLQVWNILFRATSSSTGSYDQFSEISPFLQAVTALDPNDGKMVYMGEMDVADAQQNSIARLGQTVNELNAWIEQKRLDGIDVGEQITTPTKHDSQPFDQVKTSNPLAATDGKVKLVIVDEKNPEMGKSNQDCSPKHQVPGSKKETDLTEDAIANL